MPPLADPRDFEPKFASRASDRGSGGRAMGKDCGWWRSSPGSAADGAPGVGGDSDESALTVLMLGLKFWFLILLSLLACSFANFHKLFFK